MRDDTLDRLVNAVLASPKYRNVCEAFVRQVGLRELAKHPNLKLAIKATRNKLHQVGGAFVDREMHYRAWLDELRGAVQQGDKGLLLAICEKIMRCHASTRERLPVLNRFYAETLAGLPAIASVLDVACGLNPLTIPWMPLVADVVYRACDIYQDMTDFLTACLELLGMRGKAWTCDLITSCPAEPVDLALVLKTLPCLEQIDPAAGTRLLDALPARYLLVSFPVHSLGGRPKGMVAHYQQRFRQLAAGRDWEICRFEFATELVFRIIKA